MLAGKGALVVGMARSRASLLGRQPQPAAFLQLEVDPREQAAISAVNAGIETVLPDSCEPTPHPTTLCTHQLQIASQQEYWALAVWVEQVVAMNWVRYPQLLCRAAAALRFRAVEGLRCQPLAGSFFMWM
jgi:hypothetical protein